ncbi:MAG: hypothetical protein NTV69_15725 [Caldilinea sp.]|nr:hypothetical protein [Caldilinea sp.]
MVTHGVRFPYRLEKWVSFANASMLHMAYRLTNLSPYPFDFIWAAHPMFVLEEGATLSLPGGIEKVVTVFSASNRLGRYGDEHAWPIATLADGSQRDLRQIAPKRTRDAEKYYIKGKLPAGWCELIYPQSKLTLRLEFPVAQVPYLGILPNEGGWQDLYNIFLEPATGPLDRLDVARLHYSLSVLLQLADVAAPSLPSTRHREKSSGRSGTPQHRTTYRPQRILHPPVHVGANNSLIW